MTSGTRTGNAKGIVRRQDSDGTGSEKKPIACDSTRARTLISRNWLVSLGQPGLQRAGVLAQYRRRGPRAKLGSGSGSVADHGDGVAPRCPNGTGKVGGPEARVGDWRIVTCKERRRMAQSRATQRKREMRYGAHAQEPGNEWVRAA